MKLTRLHSLSILAVAAAVSVFFSCATVSQGSGGTPSRTKGEPMPEWVSDPPADTAAAAYFIGFGSSPEGDLAEAEAQAVNTLIAEITRYIGVRISAETSVEARATLDTYTATVTEQIRQTSSATVTGFRVEEKWIDRSRAPAVSIHILGRYDMEELTAEQRRFKELFAERIEAVSGPEREGDLLAAEGSHFSAAMKYLESAVAALSPDVDNADVKFERTMNKARASLSRLSFVSVSTAVPVNTFDEFASPFVVKVAAGTAAGDPGLGNVPIEVSYREMRDGGGTRIATSRIITAADGTAEFKRPPAQFVGDDVLVMALDIAAALQPLRDLRGKNAELADGFVRVARSLRAEFPYQVLSRARLVPTGILVFDVDRNGTLMAASDAQNGITDALTGAGFTIRTLQANQSLTELSEDDLVGLVAKGYADTLKRLVFGSAVIGGFEEDEGSYIVKVEGSIKVVDLLTGQVLYSERKIKSARATSSRSAVSAAFRGLGKAFGEEIAILLP